MGRGSKGKSRQRIRDPHVYVPKGREYWYYAGTLQTRQGAVRLRGTTGVRSSELGSEQTANEHLHTVHIPNILKEVEDGIRPVAFSTAVVEWLTAKYPKGCISRPDRTPAGGMKPTNADERVALELVKHFKKTLLGDVTPQQGNSYYKDRFCDGQSVDTIKRHQNTFRSIYSHHNIPCPALKWAKPKRKRGTSALIKLEPMEVSLLVRCYPERLQFLMWLYFVTGARVSELIYLKKEHFPGARRVLIPDTKSGESDVIDLPAWLQSIALHHLQSHTSPQHKQAFLTERKQPYTVREGRGGQIRGVTDVARKNAAAELDEMGLSDRADVMRRFTPHWTRKTFANSLLDAEVSMADIMELGRWKSAQVLKDHYLAEKRLNAQSSRLKLPYGADAIPAEKARLVGQNKP